MIFRPVILLLLALATALVSAQPQHRLTDRGEVFPIRQFSENAPDLHFERVGGVEEGYNHLSIIGQDSSGFVWFTSRFNYISRFDGFRFQPYPVPRPLGNSRHVIVAETNSIWLATEQGLCCFDMADGSCQIVPNTHSPADSIIANVFYDKKRGLLFCTTSSAVFEFDLSTQRFLKKIDGFTKDAYTGETLAALPPPEWADFKISDDGKYWVTACEGERCLLYSHTPGTQEWQVFPFHSPREHPDLLLGKTPWFCYHLHLDADGRHIWTGGYGGLKRFDRTTKRWQFFTLTMPEHDNTTNLIYDVIPWGERHLALTSHVGLHLFDQETGAFFNYRFFPTKSISHWSRIVHQPLPDRNGTLWVMAGVSGIYRLDPQKQFFSKKTGLPDNFSPIYIYSRPPAWWLFGVDYQKAGWSGYKLQENNGISTRLDLPFVLSGFATDTLNGRLLLGEAVSSGGISGIWSLDLITNKLAKLNLPVEGMPGIHTGNLGLCKLTNDLTGGVWIASRRFGLLKYEPSTGKCRRILPAFGSENLLPEDSLVSVRADAAGKIWFSFENTAGIGCFDPTTSNVHYFPPPAGQENPTPGWAENLAVTADGSIWAGKPGKLFRLLPGSTTLTWVEGVQPAAGSIVTDEAGNLWCNSRRGLWVWHAATDRWKCFTGNDGLPETPGDDPVSNCTAGRIYFTGSVVFEPSQLRFDEVPPTPVFVDFRVNEKPVAAAPFLQLCHEVRLLPGERSFTIGYAATDFTNPEENTFAYRLLEVENDWVECGNRRLVSYSNLRPGHYTFQLKAANHDGVWNEKPAVLRIVIPPFFYETTWFKSLLATLAVAALFVFYKNRLKTARRDALLKQKEAELKQQEAEFKQQLAEVEMAALRSQMNPHFIFNVLNSIHYFMLTNDAEAAAAYLTKFARLVRLVLENSRSQTVTLHNDLHALALYGELEGLRFDKKLTFSITVEPSIDQKFVKIPPLLVQPYVENAIWHGLMQKKEGGSVQVEVSQPGENLLQITVTDDGIGRAAAAALKSRSSPHRKSFGMQITSRRLDLTNQLYHTEMQVSIEDLFDEKGAAAGTKVVLRVPV